MTRVHSSPRKRNSKKAFLALLASEAEPRYRRLASLVGRPAVSPAQPLEFISLLREELAHLEPPSESTARFLLTMSETPALRRDIRTFTLDAMLVAEGDFHGQYSSISELRTGLEELARNL